MRDDIIQECPRCGTYFKQIICPTYQIYKRGLSRAVLEQKSLCPKCLASLDKWWEEKE